MCVKQQVFGKAALSWGSSPPSPLRVVPWKAGPVLGLVRLCPQLGHTFRLQRFTQSEILTTVIILIRRATKSQPVPAASFAMFSASNQSLTSALLPDEQLKLIFCLADLIKTSSTQPQGPPHSKINPKFRGSSPSPRWGRHITPPIGSSER